MTESKRDKRVGETVSNVSTSHTAYLSGWLNRVEAKQLWSTHIEFVGRIAAYMINGHVVLAQVFTGDAGWELYVPACKALSVPLTLQAVEEYVGLNQGPAEPARPAASKGDAR